MNRWRAGARPGQAGHPSGWVSRRRIKDLQDIVNRHKAEHLFLKGERERGTKRQRQRKKHRKTETRVHMPREGTERSQDNNERSKVAGSGHGLTP